MTDVQASQPVEFRDRESRLSQGFVMRRRVQFAETDLAGVLHFANYYRFMEEIEHAFWRSLDMSVVSLRGERTISWPRVATSCAYFAPARFDDDLELSLTVENIGRRSVSYEVEFRHEGRRIALGHTTAVCCMMEAGRFATVSIPDAVRRKLEEHSAASGSTDAPAEGDCGND